MSKADSIQRKLWKAYGKVGKALGKYSFDIYRPTASFNNPLQDIYVIDNKVVAFSKDQTFTKPENQGVSLWYCWLDGRLEQLFDVRPGDYLYSEEAGETYYIASAGDQMYTQAIKTNDIVTISRSGYSDGGSGFQPGDMDVATSLPCYIVQPSYQGGTAGYMPASGYATDSVPNYEIYLANTFNELQIRDVVIDSSGNRSQVLSIFSTDIGTKAITKAYEP